MGGTHEFVGTLLVSSAAVGLGGDFNGDGIIDAADDTSDTTTWAGMLQSLTAMVQAQRLLCKLTPCCGKQTLKL